MRNLIFITVLILQNMFTVVARSEESAPLKLPVAPIPITVREDETLTQSLLRDAASPFTTKARNVLIAGATASVVLAALEDSVDDPIQKAATRSRPMGNVASDFGVLAGGLYPNIAYTLGMLGYGWWSGSDVARDRGNRMFRASAYAQLTTTLLKVIVREPRPGTGEKVSFPSGHTTSAFSFASTVGMEHPWYVGLAAYTYAAIVAYGRINDNRHFFHDVIGGATIGASYGIGLFLRSQQNKNSTTQLIPSDDLKGAQVVYRAEF